MMSRVTETCNASLLAAVERRAFDYANRVRVISSEWDLPLGLLPVGTSHGELGRSKGLVIVD